MRNELTLSGDRYTDREIVSGTVIMVQSLDGNELQYDTLDATLDLGGFRPTLFRPADADGLLTSEQELFGVRPLIKILVHDPASYRYGAEVLYKHDGVLVGKYYMTKLSKVSKSQYQINCVSPIGLLANSNHYGGVYTGISFSDLIAEIVGGVVPFSVAPEIAGQPVYGWLPIATRRENLHQALFAMGAAAQKDNNGDLYISVLNDDFVLNIPDERVYTGGTISYPETVSQVSVSEHSYAASADGEQITLHEGITNAEHITTPNGLEVDGTMILFSEPMHSLSIENGTIVESGHNYAVITAAAECKLTGKRYIHTVREVTRPETKVNASADNKVSVTDATLVSAANSENVVERLMEYYTSAKTLSVSVAVSTEKAGNAVSINDPFGEKIQGIISSMDITMSNTLKARAEIIADYSPGNAGNFYSNVISITESGAWVVPEEVSKIRVAVIGAGNGGEAGLAGSDGQKGSTYGSIPAMKVYRGDAGDGGAGGNGGKSGKVTIASLSVTPGQTIYATIGKGGSGAKFGEEPGIGEESTFGDITSANGSVPGSAGFVSMFDGRTYATPGKKGVAGGRGQEAGTSSSGAGAQPTVEYNGKTWVAGFHGESNGGTITNPSYSVILGVGGAGGGAAYGVNGSQGNDAIFEDDVNGPGYAIGGSGGNGATPEKAENAVIRGAGGNGGHGGGGGGGGGSYAGISSAGAAGSGGKAGNGGAGGDGAPGCVLIYY